MTATTRARPPGGEAGARRRHPTARRVAPKGRRTATFTWLLALFAVLNLLGLVMVLSASSVVSIDEYGSSWYYATKQTLWVLLGCVVLFVTMRIDYHRWRRLSLPMLGLSFVLLGLVLAPGVGRTVNGSTRWLGAGPLTIQPSEFTKLALVVFVADLLARRAAWMHDTRTTMRPVLVVLAATAFFLMLQPNLGTTMIVGAIVVAVLFVAGTPMRALAWWGGLGAVAASFAALSSSYRRERVLSFLHPLDDPLNSGYQSLQSTIGLATGGLTGTGLGASRAKWGFLPFAHTDFIFAIIGEELGLIGAVAVVAMFVLLAVFGVRAALLAPDRFGMLIAAGVTSWFLVQAFVNIGAVIGILPITGVPLPFVSFGGSSLVFSMAAAGMLLNVARQGRPAGTSTTNSSR